MAFKRNPAGLGGATGGYNQESCCQETKFHMQGYRY
jgi:hypothetical protein